MIYTIKKKLQFLFKKFFYGLFKIIYNEIKDFESAETNINTKVEISKIEENFNYKVFFVNKLYVLVKFMFCKATKFDKIFTVNLTLCSKCQIDGEDFVNFCGLLRKHEL